jgi:ornithine carbamoyltransferase
MTRQFIQISQLSNDDLATIYDGARATTSGNELHGVNVSLVFEFPSLRTRASSVAAVQRLGANYSMFTGDEIGIDSRESAEDVARTLAQTSDVVALRVKNHAVFDRMISATTNQLHFINLLSYQSHPTQAVADVLCLADAWGAGNVDALQGRTLAYVGDATNVTRSLAAALVRLGVSVRIAAPTGYQLNDADLRAINAQARHGGELLQSDDPVEAVSSADAVYTDSWISMGVEAEADDRRQVFAPYQVNSKLMSLAAPDALILHCLPAHRGEEITNEVLAMPTCLVWQQVRHRTSSMVGVLRWMKGTS